ncbi:MAG: FadR/GntR family transcriptional regulator [Pseudomonadota bacterium]
MGATPDLASRLRAWIDAAALPLNARLPPERTLAVRFAVSRGELRKALDVLEGEGLIWRHVGRGTFIGSRPVHDLADVAFLGELANPAQVMEARLALEPALARLAALHGVAPDFAKLEDAARRCREAKEWRAYEAADEGFHLGVARATHNKLLLNLFERLDAVRRATVWGRLRVSRLPPADHPSFAQHDAIARAIRERAADAAAEAMRTHLDAVRQRVLASLHR